MNSGLFITFEGPDGSGKSTQARIFYDRLLQLGCDAVFTREPGGTPISEKIRTLILDPSNVGMDPRAEALLYAASRAQLVSQFIAPALETGKTVVCDRYIDSSVAYQGFARGLGSGVRLINDFGSGGLLPDITFFLDLDPELGIRRAAAAKGGADRMELETLAFHRAVYEGYLEICGAEPGRFVRIDASGSIEDVAGAIMDAYVGRLKADGL